MFHSVCCVGEARGQNLAPVSHALQAPVDEPDRIEGYTSAFVVYEFQNTLSPCRFLGVAHAGSSPGFFGSVTFLGGACRSNNVASSGYRESNGHEAEPTCSCMKENEPARLDPNLERYEMQRCPGGKRNQLIIGNRVTSKDTFAKFAGADRMTPPNLRPKTKGRLTKDRAFWCLALACIRVLGSWRR
ncbi:hypothetical protein LX32DRAFT_644829 [Colletotrichum zoysiae]|uniref:Uncharacterized protein n=1 Tax=Colletotrichum zoysiae TaxID=1216348 RepID=A0AAD9H7G2_9PEZI|nr:hypothetical protein LX32DRAFT_644829 [Colletotrichum zoysiae]